MVANLRWHIFLGEKKAVTRDITLVNNRQTLGQRRDGCGKKRWALFVLTCYKKIVDALQPLDTHKFAGVKQVLNRNIAHTAKQHPVNPQLLVKAPLATPEHIEIGQEYATVRVRYTHTCLQSVI